MAQSQVTSNLRVRRSFGKIKKIIDIPNLIEIQKRSYDEFLQHGVSSDERQEVGFRQSSSRFFRSRTSTRPRRWSSSAMSSVNPSTMSKSAINVG